MAAWEVPHMRMTDIRAGWAVVGNDGRHIGKVHDVGQDYILTSRPGFAPDLFVPVSSIANVENEVIRLNVPQGVAERMGWEQKPRQDAVSSDADSDLHRHV